MKYLLTTSLRQLNRKGVRIEIQNGNEVFDSLKEMINYLFENAIDFKSFKMYELHDIDGDDDDGGINLTNGCGGFNIPNFATMD